MKRAGDLALTCLAAKANDTGDFGTQLRWAHTLEHTLEHTLALLPGYADKPTTT